MTFTLTYAWWWIPTLITVLAFGYLWIPKNHGGNFPDIGAAIDCFFAVLVIAIAWAVGGFFK